MTVSGDLGWPGKETFLPLEGEVRIRGIVEDQLRQNLKKTCLQIKENIEQKLCSLLKRVQFIVSVILKDGRYIATVDFVDTLVDRVVVSLYGDHGCSC